VRHNSIFVVRVSVSNGMPIRLTVSEKSYSLKKALRAIFVLIMFMVM